MLSLAVKPDINAVEIETLKQLFGLVQKRQLDSTTNAEMMATQQISAEIAQAMPEIQRQAQEAAQNAQNIIDSGDMKAIDELMGGNK